MEKVLSTTALKAIISASLALTLAAPAVSAAASTDGSAPAAQANAEAAAGPVMAPIRQAAESLGAHVQWNAADRSVTLSKGATSIVVKIGGETATVNGEEVPIGRKAEMIGQTAHVPVEFINRVLNASIEWNPEQGKVMFGADDVEGQASQFIYRLNRGDVNEILFSATAGLKEAMPPEAFALFAMKVKAAFGELSKQLSSSVSANGVHTNVTMLYEAANTPIPIEFTVRFDKDRQIDDFTLSLASEPAASYQSPSYDRPETYSEREVVIGDGPFALPGTLTMPKGEGRFPAVILVHGSGPHDRDSTIGGTKPFKDLAAGLASQGIAVLRYEKVTKEHTAKVSGNPKFTLKDESVADVLKAAELLKQTEGIDPAKIFAAGHSQGGYAMPLILESDEAGTLAGAVLLSAPSENMTTVIIEQQKEVLERMKLLGLPEEIVAQQGQSSAMWTAIAESVNNPEYSKDNLPPNFPLQPAYWWFEQRDYRPAEEAKELSKPMLILQGENDWQVSMNQFGLWKEALKDRTDVEFKSYADVNHVLAAYKDVSIGLEYNEPSNVSEEIVQDIAAWIKKQ
ncbi:stalk domain-containing protein [Paenibacillus thermotolerans]|uniref:alpha/beta hydrolase family protein n=1 Tax=Paenibacillus thermotolerans TaxID=3027807 RepID=UPI002367F4DC|nr:MULTISPECIES: stalk domain-containing protein [unclassified Paenibacillus]